MDLIKGTITALVKRSKNDGSGDYFSVTVKQSNGTEIKYLCFDAKMKEKNMGDTIEFSSVQKGDVWYLNFPKEGKSGGGWGKSQFVKDDTYAKINGLLQSHTMPMSYTKDLTVALIEKGMPMEDVERYMVKLYRTLRAEILKDTALMSLLGAKAEAGKEVSNATQAITQTKTHGDFAKALDEFLDGLKDYSEDTLEKICFRLSQIKTPEGKLTGGQKLIKDMTETEAKVAFDRFQMFRSRECVKNPKECEYWKAGNKCSWISTCLYK